VNAAFLSGNACDGRIQFYPNRAGVPCRSFSRIGKFGILERELKQFAGKWKEHGPNPATLMGARSTSPYNGTADWMCVNQKHWLFEGTGMKNGDSINGLVGWEHHGDPAKIPGLEIVAKGPVFSGGRPQGVEYTATIHPGPKGNLVFNAATIWWSDGLSAPPGYLRPWAHGGTPPGPTPACNGSRRIFSSAFCNEPVQRPVLLLVVSAVLWSTGGLLIKTVECDALTLAGCRSGIAALAIYLLMPGNG